MNTVLNLKNTVLLAAAASFFSIVGCSSEESIVYSNENSPVFRDGKIIDPRDNNSYGVALIGDLYWMTENLRYADSVSTKNLAGNTWCHEDDAKCEKYGRLYSWTAALDFDKKFNSASVGYVSSTKGICPNGWRIPSGNDWLSLVNYVETNNGGEGSGTSLKSTETWSASDEVRKPTNRFGFGAKASGRRNNDGETFMSTGRIAFFWSSNEHDNGTAEGWQLRHDVDVIQLGNFYKDHGLAVRCVANKNSANIVTGKDVLDSSYLEKIPQDYGTLKIGDQSYRTIEIDGVTWMADNVNVNDDGSSCYNDDKEYCKEYGRLYSYETALKICPDGWQLPTKTQYSSLKMYAKTNAALRSTLGWSNNASKGLNFWGFDAKPAGGMDGKDFFDLKASAYFWVNENLSDESKASTFWINYYDQAPSFMSYDKKNKYSVRCVKK